MSIAVFLLVFNWTCYSARSEASAEYWIHFTARFGDVHAFGYNSTESEPIWMKSGALRVHCRWLALTDFGRDPHSTGSWRARRNFYSFLSGKQRTISPISRQPNFTKFAHTRRSVRRWKLSEQNFENFIVRGHFFKKRKNFQRPRLQASITIIDCRKFTTRWYLYGMSSFHFYCWNQFIVIPLYCTLRTKNLHKCSATSDVRH